MTDVGLEHVVAAREEFIDTFRRRGIQRPDLLTRAEQDAREVVATSTGEARALAQLEVGTLRRLGENFAEAIPEFEKATRIAEEEGLSDVEFKAWIGIARSHCYGTKDHGAAQVAFDRAVAAAGDSPDRQQRAEIAGYRAQLLITRGELEAALVSGVEAIDLAQKDEDRFYAHFDTADALLKFAESCDYRKLVDAESQNDGDESWGACYRSVDAAEAVYDRTAAIASERGWTALVQQVNQAKSLLGMRRILIRARADNEKIHGVFHPSAA